MGLALLAIGLGSLQVVLDRGQRLDWFQSEIIVVLATVAGSALVAALVWEYFAQNPILDLRLFRHRHFSVAFLMMGLLAGILYSTLLLIPVQMVSQAVALSYAEIFWMLGVATLCMTRLVLLVRGERRSR
jgi:DHA2 family multidrug resistance protein